MSNLVLLFLFILLSYFLSKSKWVKRSGIKTHILISLFAIKSLVGFALVILYSTYYSKDNSDIWLYFNDALFLKDLFINHRDVFWNILFDHNIHSESTYKYFSQLMYWDSPKVDFLLHEKRIVILLNLLFSFISFGNIYINSMLMAFVGFMGQIAIFRFVKKQTQIEPFFVLLISFLLPTFLLWSSSILKEPLIIFSMGFLLFYLGKWTKKWKVKYLAGVILFYTLAFFIKPYVVLSLTFPLFIFILFKFKASYTFKKQSVTVLILTLVVFVSLSFLSVFNFNVFEKLANKQADFYKNIEQAEQIKEVGSKIELDRLNPSFTSFLLNSPKAFSNVMFRPGIYEYKNLLYYPDIFQNLLILLIGILIMFKTQKPKPSEFPFLWLSLLFVFVLFIVIGIVTPVLGAIVRYKIPALIFVFFFMLSFLKVSKDFSKINGILFQK